MAPILNAFLNDTEIFVAAFYKDRIKEYVISNPEITKDHGKEGISNLKSECKDLLKKIPELVKMNMDNDKLWSHKWPIDDLKRKRDVYHNFSTHYDRHDADEDIIKSLRYVLGYLGELLAKYNYIATEKYSAWERSYDGKFTYRGRVDCTHEMKDSLKNYLEIDKELTGLIGELESIEEQKEKAEAENLWDIT